MLSLDTWLVIAGWILGLALLFYNLRSKTRSVSRVAVSTVLLVTCTLMYGYHLLIVQGSLNISFTEEKGRMLRVIDTEQEYWNKTCEIHEYECGTIRKDNALNYHDDIINKEINDFLSFYKEVSADPVFLL